MTFTGTGWLVDSVYPEQLAGTDGGVRAPSATELNEINRIIMEWVACGVFKPGAVAHFQRVVGRMKEQRCDALVLGCTSLPLIVSDANSSLPTLDSTRLFAPVSSARSCPGWRSLVSQ